MRPFLELFHAFEFLLNNPAIAELAQSQRCVLQVAPNLPQVIHWMLPENCTNGRRIQTDTLLGALFSFSPFRSPEVGNTYFRDSRFIHQAAPAFNTIRTTHKFTIDTLFRILMCFLRPTSTRKAGLMWITQVLRLNKQRGQMAHHVQQPDVLRTTSTDGFMLNLCHVLLQVCKPFTCDRKLSKIKIEFLKLNDIGFDISDETLLSPVGENESVPPARPRFQPDPDFSAQVDANTTGEMTPETLTVTTTSPSITNTTLATTDVAANQSNPPTSTVTETAQTNSTVASDAAHTLTSASTATIPTQVRFQMACCSVSLTITF